MAHLSLRRPRQHQPLFPKNKASELALFLNHPFHHPLRWKDLRATEGWTALQHHAIFRTTITLFPQLNSNPHTTPHLLVQLNQASYFTLRPQSHPLSSFVPEWYAGNIYDMDPALPRVVPLPQSPSLLEPTSYDVFISADYEVSSTRCLHIPLH